MLRGDLSEIPKRIDHQEKIFFPRLGLISTVPRECIRNYTHCDCTLVSRHLPAQRDRALKLQRLEAGSNCRNHIIYVGQGAIIQGVAFATAILAVDQKIRTFRQLKELTSKSSFILNTRYRPSAILLNHWYVG